MSSLKLIPLGTVAPYCKDDKKCPGYLIKYNEQNIVLDLGNGAISNMNLPENLSNLKVFISHFHPDHYGDLTALFEAALVYNRLGFLNGVIPIYLPKYYIKEDMYYTGEDGWYTSKTLEKTPLDYRYLEQYQKNCPIKIIGYDKLNIEENGIKISSLVVPHTIKSNAIKVEIEDKIIVYSSDTGTKNNLREFAKNADLFICEATFLKGQSRLDDSHLFAYEAAQIARDANVKELALTHFWPEIDKSLYVKEAKEYFDNVCSLEERKEKVLIYDKRSSK